MYNIGFFTIASRVKYLEAASKLKYRYLFGFHCSLRLVFRIHNIP